MAEREESPAFLPVFLGSRLACFPSSTRCQGMSFPSASRFLPNSYLTTEPLPSMDTVSATSSIYWLYSPITTRGISEHLAGRCPISSEVHHPSLYSEQHALKLNKLLRRYNVGRVMMDTRPIRIGSIENYELGAGNVRPSICSKANRREGGTG